MFVRCEFQRKRQTRHVNPHSETARLIPVDDFLKSMGGGFTVVKPYGGGDHESMYAQVSGAGHVLSVDFRPKWRTIFYPRKYSDAVLAHKSKVVDANTHQSDLSKPRHERRWRYENEWYVNTSGGPGEATVDHDPAVVVHFKTQGNNMTQKDREAWYIEGGDVRPPVIMPRKKNSSQGSDGERADPWLIGPDFRGPGDR
jgi:hypothetical protein